MEMDTKKWKDKKEYYGNFVNGKKNGMEKNMA